MHDILAPSQASPGVFVQGSGSCWHCHTHTSYGTLYVYLAGRTLEGLELCTQHGTLASLWRPPTSWAPAPPTHPPLLPSIHHTPLTPDSVVLLHSSSIHGLHRLQAVAVGSWPGALRAAHGLQWHAGRAGGSWAAGVGRLEAECCVCMAVSFPVVLETCCRAGLFVELGLFSRSWQMHTHMLDDSTGKCQGVCCAALCLCR